MVKSFKNYISEEPAKKTDKPPTEVDRVRSRQKQLKKDTKAKETSELKRAREIDFQRSEAEKERKMKQGEAEKRAKEASTSESLELQTEVLEVGTETTVRNYREKVPGQ